MREKIEQAVSDWLDDNFADLQPWEEDGVIEQDIWDDLWRRIKLYVKD